MSTRTRPLHTPKKHTATAAKRVMLMSQLDPRRMAKWANRNVIQFMNHESSSVGRRITEVVEWCKQVSNLREQLEVAHSSNEGANNMELLHRLNVVLADLNRRLSKFKWHPVVRAYFGARPTYFSVVYEFNATSKSALFENNAIQWVMDHIDVVHRIRRCRDPQCRNWFFAVTEHQKFCRDSCRKRYASRSDEFKAKRARYMRLKYRPLIRQLEKRDKPQAAKRKGR